LKWREGTEDRWAGERVLVDIAVGGNSRLGMKIGHSSSYPWFLVLYFGCSFYLTEREKSRQNGIHYRVSE
jgi:hypothetical protein